MFFSTHLNGIAVSMLFILTFGISQTVCADVTVKTEGQNIVMENERLKLVIVPFSGLRIASLVNKQTGKDLKDFTDAAFQRAWLRDNRRFCRRMQSCAREPKANGRTI